VAEKNSIVTDITCKKKFCHQILEGKWWILTETFLHINWKKLWWYFSNSNEQIPSQFWNLPWSCLSEFFNQVGPPTSIKGSSASLRSCHHCWRECSSGKIHKIWRYFRPLASKIPPFSIPTISVCKKSLDNPIFANLNSKIREGGRWAMVVKGLVGWEETPVS